MRSVACGTWHTTAIIAECFKYNTSFTGKLFTWGNGDEGRLGHSDNGNKLVPTCVSQLVDYDFVQVSCGKFLQWEVQNLDNWEIHMLRIEQLWSDKLLRRSSEAES